MQCRRNNKKKWKQRRRRGGVEGAKISRQRWRVQEDESPTDGCMPVATRGWLDHASGRGSAFCGSFYRPSNVFSATLAVSDPDTSTIERQKQNKTKQTRVPKKKPKKGGPKRKKENKRKKPFL